jgi:hypothetical protein
MRNVMMRKSISPLHAFSKYSIASLALSGLAIALTLVGVWFGKHSPGSGPAEGAAALFVVATCLIAAWFCTLLGAIFGWVGARRSSSAKGFARAIAAVNTTVCVLPAIPLVLWLIVIIFSSAG